MTHMNVDCALEGCGGSLIEYCGEFVAGNHSARRAQKNIKDVKLTKTFAGMRDGQYATVRFDSSFAHKSSAVETVVLTSEKGGWSVIGYVIN